MGEKYMYDKLYYDVTIRREKIEENYIGINRVFKVK